MDTHAKDKTTDIEIVTITTSILEHAHKENNLTKTVGLKLKNRLTIYVDAFFP